MTLREQIIKDLIHHEGKENFVYLDTKKIETIGVGRNLRHVGLSDDEITHANNDIDRVENNYTTFPGGKKSSNR